MDVAVKTVLDYLPLPGRAIKDALCEEPCPGAKPRSDNQQETAHYRYNVRSGSAAAGPLVDCPMICASEIVSVAQL